MFVLPLTYPKLIVPPNAADNAVKPAALTAFVCNPLAVQEDAFHVVPLPHAVYNAVPAIVAGLPVNPYTLFVADELTDEYVVNNILALVIVDPTGIVLRSKVAHPLLVDELMVTICPSFFVPVELTEPDFNEPAVPVHVNVVVTCAFSEATDNIVNNTVKKRQLKKFFFVFVNRFFIFLLLNY